ncbi:polysaccharide biosynthesis tyrosine autokinase [candidate division KSB1 bacterium]|nr:polysaccharide biosynthesis tyrosine autokinase [candidate division KSB1 bacterium]
MQQSTLRDNQTEKSIFLEYFQILRRRKWIVIISMIGIIIPIATITQLTTPVFEAEATIIYEEPQDTMFALDMGQPFYNKSAVINLTEQIKSRTLAEEVAKAIPPEIIEKFKFPDPLPANFSPVKFIASRLKRNVSVALVRGSDILKIKIQANDPIATSVVTNTYVDKLIDLNLQKKREEIINIGDFIEKQLAIFGNRVEVSDDSLKSYKERNKLVSLSDASQEILSRITDAEVSYNQVSAEREALERRMNYINKKREQLAPFINVSPSSKAQQLKDELTRLEVQYSSARLQGGSSEKSDLTILEQKINQVKNELIQELLTTTQQENLIDPLSQVRSLLQESITLDVELETYKAREQGMKKIIDNYNQELRTIPRQEFDLARLVRDKEINDKIYTMLLEKREEARITEAGKIGDIRIIDAAEIPRYPIKPNKQRNLILAILLGMAFGIGLAFFLESLDTSLKSQEDIEKFVNLPVLASIPGFSENGVLNKVGQKNGSEGSNYQKLLSHAMTKPHVYEAYRSLQLNLSFASPDKPVKSILVTSACAGEGKTLTAANMAQFFSQNGTRTLLIDCDLRRPTVHNTLQIDQEPGLTNLLIDTTMSLGSSIQSYYNENLSILTSGTLPPNPSEILNSQKMKDVLTEAKAHYDLLILDAPPVIAVTDSIILGAEIDGICLVIRSGKTSQDAVIKAIKMIENSGIKIIGIILNDVNLKNVYGYYKDYYYYSKKEKTT